MFSSSDWYIVQKEFSDENINNVKTYHYLISLNKPEIEKTFADFIKKSQGDISQNPSFEKVNFEELASSILEKIFTQVGDVRADVWIGKNDFYLYKMHVEKMIDLSTLNLPTKDKANIIVDIYFSQFDQLFNIEAPKDFKNIKDILGGQLPLQIGL